MGNNNMNWIEGMASQGPMIENDCPQCGRSLDAEDKVSHAGLPGRAFLNQLSNTSHRSTPQPSVTGKVAVGCKSKS